MTTVTNIRPITILLVDDDADYRGLLHDAIAQCGAGHVVQEVANGAEALTLLRRAAERDPQTLPDLIYLDIEMPEMTGLEALRQIKGDPVLRRIAVVMMTGVDEDHYKRLAAAYGANSYTLKPSNPATFAESILAATEYWTRVHRFPENPAPDRDESLP